MVYCSCEGLSANDLRRLILSTHNRTRTIPGPRYWFLDEITAVAGWSSVIKYLRDTDGQFADACVVLAGSSARDLRDATSDLAGRRGPIIDSDRLLLPMGFRDFARAVGRMSDLVPTTRLRPQDVHSSEGQSAVWELEPFIGELDDVWQLFLDVGGFPQAVSEFVRSGAVSDALVCDLLDVVQGDIVRNTRLSELEALALLDRLTQNICSPINLTSVATDVGLRDNERADDRYPRLGRELPGLEMPPRRPWPHTPYAGTAEAPTTSIPWSHRSPIVETTPTAFLTHPRSISSRSR